VPTTATARLLHVAQERGVLRSRDLANLGIARTALARLHRADQLHGVARGRYVPAPLEPSAQHSLVEACARVPRGVVCLLSALLFHDLGTQLPFEVWLAIPGKAWPPHAPELPLRIVRFSGAAYTAGIETHLLEGVPVRVYNPAKTIADCFKYRNKIGLDVALEALREAWRERRVTMDELWQYARLCRVANVMLPYLESLG
jgi:predicted transcriptional regulator of viral defense system